MEREFVTLETPYGDVLADHEYLVLEQGKDYVGIKYKGGTRYIPKTYIARKKYFTKDNEENLPTYEEIVEKEQKELEGRKLY